MRNKKSDNPTTPLTTIKGRTLWPIPEFTDIEVSLGAKEDAFFPRHDLPDVPRKYEDMANKLFFSGGQLPNFAPQVDRNKAALALRAWLSSFNPAHEAKTATAGYALWLWSDEQAIAGACAAGDARRGTGQ